MRLRAAALRFAATALLGFLTTPVAWAAAPDKVIPFTTYQLEQQAIVDALPCKWISMDGRLGPSYGTAGYDFLCKGGQWATVSLYLDRANGFDHGVGRVRLYYREWRDNVHPSAGEAFEAQKFLEYVVNRFVPASAGAQVLQAFWSGSKRSWGGKDVRVVYALEEGDNYDVHKLEIVGQGSALVNVDGLILREQRTGIPTPAKAKSITDQPVPIIPVSEGPVTPSDAGLLKPQAPMRAEEVARPPLPAPAVTLPNANVLPTPQDSASPLPASRNGLVLPPALQETATPQEPPLPKASAAELNTSPAPESLAKPAPLPPISASLVPDPNALIEGRTRAPSNFDAYNKASELTKSVEKRALTSSTPVKPIVTPAGQAQKTLAVPSATTVSFVPPVETPRVNAPVAGNVSATVKAPAPSGEGLGMSMGGAAPAARDPARPLPQLQFVPKAEPLKSGDDVLQFEDEKSGL